MVDAPSPTKDANTPINFINADSKEYTIELSTDDSYILIKVIDKDSILGSYSSKKSLKDFQDISKCFRVFDNIGEVLEFILCLIREKKLMISEGGNSLLFEMEVSVANKTETVSLRIEKENFDEKATIIKLCKKISEMQKELKSLREMKMELMGSPDFHMSRIVKYEKELDFVKEQIKENLALNKDIKDIKFSPLFSTDRDSDSAGEFHKKCDGKDKILVLVKTKTGRKFGGFTSAQFVWNNDGYISDQKAFLFSLDKNKCYKILTDDADNAIYYENNLGPVFGAGHDLCLSDRCCQNCESVTNKESYDYGDNSDNSELNDTDNFVVDCYEVYQLNK